MCEIGKCSYGHAVWQIVRPGSVCPAKVEQFYRLPKERQGIVIADFRGGAFRSHWVRFSSLSASAKSTSPASP
jgi:hypothetical protein